MSQLHQSLGRGGRLSLRHETTPLSNQPFKLTRLPACQLSGPCSAENPAAHWPCTRSAVQLNAGVARQEER